MNCKCRKRLIDKLIKFHEDIDGKELIYNLNFHDFCLNKKVCQFCVRDVILLSLHTY